MMDAEMHPKDISEIYFQFNFEIICVRVKLSFDLETSDLFKFVFNSQELFIMTIV
jgi:hypothetical protein